MEYAFLLLTLLLAVGTARASPQITTEAPTPRNIFSDFFSSVGALARRFAQSIGNAGRRSVEAIRKFGERVPTATRNLLKQPQQFSRELGGSVRDLLQTFLATLRAFSQSVELQMQNMQNEMQLELLRQVSRQLSEVNGTAQELQEMTLTLRQQWGAKVNVYEEETLRMWNNWAGEQLEAVAEANNGSKLALQQAERVINEFINRYSNFLSLCAEQAEAELRVYETRVQALVTRYQPVLEALVARVELCLESDASSRTACVRNPRAELQQLLEASSEFQQLSARGRDLLEGRYDRRACVMQTRAEFNMERYDVERRTLYCKDCGGANGEG